MQKRLCQLERAFLAPLLCALALSARADFTKSDTISHWGQTLSDGVVYIVPHDMALSAWGGENALSVAAGATAVIYIPSNVTLSVTGGHSSGMGGAGAGIEVPSSSTLVVTGQGTLAALGGYAAGAQIKTALLKIEGAKI